MIIKSNERNYIDHDGETQSFLQFTTQNYFWTTVEPYSGKKKIILNFMRHHANVFDDVDNIMVINIPIYVERYDKHPGSTIANSIYTALRNNGLTAEFTPYIILPHHILLSTVVKDVVETLFGRNKLVQINVDQDRNTKLFERVMWYIPRYHENDIKRYRLMGGKCVNDFMIN